MHFGTKRLQYRCNIEKFMPFWLYYFDDLIDWAVVPQ